MAKGNYKKLLKDLKDLHKQVAELSKKLSSLYKRMLQVGDESKIKKITKQIHKK